MTTQRTLKIGTRGSRLALAQTGWVQKQLEQAWPEWAFETVVIKTTGDLHTDRPETLGKGHFTDTIEEQLLSGAIDLAVHSLKDLPTVLSEGLILGAVPVREDPRDVLVGLNRSAILERGRNVVIGTSSLRRSAQLKVLFPECQVKDIRGNIHTRLGKVDEGTVDVAVLAAAGLARLSLSDRVTEVLPPEEFVPAPGQGALGIEINRDHADIQEIMESLHDEATGNCVVAERAFLQQLGGGCGVPVGALAVIEDDHLHLRGRVMGLAGDVVFDRKSRGPAADAEALGTALAEQLLSDGAGRLLVESADG